MEYLSKEFDDPWKKSSSRKAQNDGIQWWMVVRVFLIILSRKYFNSLTSQKVLDMERGFGL